MPRPPFASALVLGIGLAAMTVEGAVAADLFGGDVASVLRTDTFSAEVFTGYLATSGREYVYDPSSPHAKVSQLNWETSGAAVGGRLAVRPLDWLTLRARGWALVASENRMVDYDWFGGYHGQDSWTHRSIHPDTSSPKAWQIDASAAVGIYDFEDIGLSAIGGYRQFTQKWRANGGAFVYSQNGFRDAVGQFPDGLVGTYQQWWRTPYAGLGATWTTPAWSASTELVGSPFVMGDDRDFHALRNTEFRKKYAMSGFVGASASLEYRFSPVLSLVGRVEYQKYLEASGDDWITNYAAGTTSYYPKPTGGAGADSLLLSVGAKVRL